MHPVGIFLIVLVVLVIVGGVGWLVYVRWRAQKLGLPPPTITSFNPFRKSQPSLYDGPQHSAPGGGGVTGWINDKLRSLRNGRNTRTAAGAYEGAAGVPAGGGGGRTRGGGGALDPDEAWDTRVGNEADGYYEYEDQELGLHPQHGDGTYQMNLATELGPGPSSTSTSTAQNRTGAATNPFGDDSGYEYEGRGRAPAAAAAAAPASFRTRAGGANPFDDDVADSASNASLRGVSPRPISTAAPGGAQKLGHDGGSPTERAERRSIFREDV
ncbi:hypothetical protein MAPG_01032 [Magnaporthiopsis poae ATCC 64411]|uniref:Acid phosphatase-like protein n=1 Tax=Magnaporthiopsis poae (strain ATCC 64411 / 73-15) TaxID=644358 RepID=A0A0C4DMM1_MAGP6|nr:hypothetical protein MAPG_01032 [Magnaporthiopsis poae ATCC 64411]